jgi:hypothetical protein
VARRDLNHHRAAHYHRCLRALFRAVMPLSNIFLVMAGLVPAILFLRSMMDARVMGERKRRRSSNGYARA